MSFATSKLELEAIAAPTIIERFQRDRCQVQHANMAMQSDACRQVTRAWLCKADDALDMSARTCTGLTSYLCSWRAAHAADIADTKQALPAAGVLRTVLLPAPMPGGAEALPADCSPPVLAQLMTRRAAAAFAKQPSAPACAHMFAFNTASKRARMIQCRKPFTMPQAEPMSLTGISTQNAIGTCTAWLGIAHSGHGQQDCCSDLNAVSE